MTSPASPNPVTKGFTPYSSALQLFDSDPAWVSNVEDAQRIKAYDLYSRMYWNEPGWCKLVKRGDDTDDQNKDIYLPSSRKIIEAINRFLAKDYNFVVDARIGATADQTILKNYFDSFYDREKIRSKFGMNKRSGLYKGDALFHITADDSKAQGERISLHRVDPVSWFPIFDDDTNTRVVGCHLVELVQDPRDDKKQIAKRQTYEKGPQWILSSLTYWEIDAWDDRNLKPDQLKRVSGTGLLEWEDKELTGIPVVPIYHWKNMQWDDYAFGVSELRGYESAIAAVNQSITDEDLTLIMQGLGVFWTNAGPPIDENNNEAQLTVGPGVILEVPDGNSIGRLSGVSSVAPMQEHMQFILSNLDSSKGISDIANGKVEVTVAESGISLALQLSPLLSGNAEKELELLGSLNQMHFDLGRYWLRVYEGVTAGATAVVKTVVGDPIPVNRKAKIDETIQLYAANLILPEMAVQSLEDLGWVFPEGGAEALLKAAAKKVAAETPVDPFATQGAANQGAANDASGGAGAQGAGAA